MAKGECIEIVPSKYESMNFFRDLIELSFREFDVILGMDWLSRH